MITYSSQLLIQLYKEIKRQYVITPSDIFEGGRPHRSSPKKMFFHRKFENDIYG